ncbi:hypothetical protein [Alkalicoccus luteus]|uniref:Uncharacterized protein n=1 Tax=Alkalicoccus luteus TaxID=1237094 RepID=A0A969TVK5_9BACI|nr:hypothetical protein [Alkalicoccus luteus]NJP38500.1 hypothetical protein [Alkalicoccus luteus]
MEMVGALGMLFFIALSLLPLILAILLIIWVYQLKKNSDLQTEQMKRVIALLEQERAGSVNSPDHNRM